MHIFLLSKSLSSLDGGPSSKSGPDQLTKSNERKSQVVANRASFLVLDGSLTLSASLNGPLSLHSLHSRFWLQFWIDKPDFFRGKRGGFVDLDRRRRGNIELRPPRLLSFEDGFRCHRCCVVRLSMGEMRCVVNVFRCERARWPKDIRHVFYLQLGWALMWAGPFVQRMSPIV